MPPRCSSAPRELFRPLEDPAIVFANDGPTVVRCEYDGCRWYVNDQEVTYGWSADDAYYFPQAEVPCISIKGTCTISSIELSF